MLAGDIPIIVLTGRCDSDFSLKALEAGASDYVMKSNFGYDGLAISIRYALFRAELQARNNLLVAALEAAANGIMITDKSAAITWVNSPFTRLTGYSTEEAIGLSRPLCCTQAYMMTFFISQCGRCITQGKYWRGELINKRKNGTLYHEELTIAPVKNTAGNITHFIGLKHDITERKQLEKQLQKLANTDPLIHLFNRRVFLEKLTLELALLARVTNANSHLINDRFGSFQTYQGYLRSWHGR